MSQLKHLLLLVFTVLAIFTQFVANADNKCRALVLQGGGDKGAYEAGVLYGFVNYTQNPEDFAYDVVTGISVGSINALNMAQFPKGKEADAVEYLTKCWNNTNRTQIYINWPYGIAEGILSKSSLFNNTPEEGYLYDHVETAPNQRYAIVVATDFNTGEKVTFNNSFWQDNITLAVDTALYSSAVPFVFEYRIFEGRVLVDGGWSGEGLDIEDAVEKCRELVSDDKDIIVDVIFAGNVSYTNISGNHYTSLEVLSRYSTISSYISGVRSFAYATEDYPEVDFRYVMIASQKLPNQDVPLDFSHENIEFMINLGIQDAKAALEKGPHDGKERILEEAKRYL